MLWTLNVGVWRNQTGSPFPFPVFEDIGSFGHLGEPFSLFLLPRPTLVTLSLDDGVVRSQLHRGVWDDLLVDPLVQGPPGSSGRQD